MIFLALAIAAMLAGSAAAGPVTEQLRRSIDRVMAILAEGDYATVRMKIQPKQGEDIAVDYRLHRRDERWLVYDVSIGGVSLIANYRTQFNTIIQTSSYAELLTRIRARLRELETLPAAAVSRDAAGAAVPR